MIADLRISHFAGRWLCSAVTLNRLQWDECTKRAVAIAVDVIALSGLLADITLFNAAEFFQRPMIVFD